MSDAPYRLITAGPSPYGRKVAVALAEKGIVCETVYDLPWADAVETRRYSPLEQLPILVPANGDPIYDSAMILDWLELVHPTPALVPHDLPERLNCMRRRLLGERLMEVMQALVFELHRDDPATATVDRLTRKLNRGLAALEAEVDAHGGGGPPCDQGVIATSTTLLCWEFVIEQGIAPPIDALQWRGRYRKLTEQVAEAQKRPSFAATAPLPMEIDIRSEVFERR